MLFLYTYVYLYFYTGVCDTGCSGRPSSPGCLFQFNNQKTAAPTGWQLWQVTIRDACLVHGTVGHRQCLFSGWKGLHTSSSFISTWSSKLANLFSNLASCNFGLRSSLTAARLFPPAQCWLVWKLTLLHLWRVRRAAESKDLSSPLRVPEPWKDTLSKVILLNQTRQLLMMQTSYSIRLSRLPAGIWLLLQILCPMERHSWRPSHW